MACAIDVRLAGPRLSRTFHLVVVRPTRCSKNCFMHAVWPKRDILYLSVQACAVPRLRLFFTPRHQWNTDKGSETTFGHLLIP